MLEVNNPKITDDEKEIWKLILDDEKLRSSILEWNSHIESTQTKKLSELERSKEQIEEGKQNEEQQNEERKAKLISITKKISKKKEVLQSIQKTGGFQLCHADTVVIAALLTFTDEIEAYEKYCNVIVENDDIVQYTSLHKKETQTIKALMGGDDIGSLTLRGLTYRVLVEALNIQR